MPVQVSNPDKVMFPDTGLTKRDLVAHYERVAPTMLPHLAGRPLTLQRFPNGIQGSGFLQKNAPAHFPSDIGRVEVPKRDGTTTYPLVDDVRGLLYLANLGTIVFHVWTSRLPDLDRPDRLVLDIDPPEGDPESARLAAGLVREVLVELDLPSVPMTTGSKGYHLITAISPTAPAEESAELSRIVAELAAVRHPDLLTTEFRIERRRGRTFLDWLRNRPGQTGVAPWSLRARPGAPVAVPFGWDELPDTPPDRWTLESIDDRLASGDPLLMAADKPVDLGPAVAAARSLADEAGVEIVPFDRFRS